MKKILAKIWWTIILGSVMIGISCADSEGYWWMLLIFGGIVAGVLTSSTFKVAFPAEDYPEKTWDEIEEDRRISKKFDNEF